MILVLVLVLVSIFTLPNTVFAEETISIKIVLSENDGENPIVYYFKLVSDTNYTLLELMQRKFIIEHNNGFITSIQSKVASNTDKTAWMYTINGEMAMVGAGQYKIKNGDEFHWDLRKW